MPNWVFNHLNAIGNELDIKRLKKQVGQPFTREYVSEVTGEKETVTFDNPIFSFWNIYPPIDLEAYHGSTPSGIPFEEAIKYKGNNWWDFNIREWGTKWDVAVHNDDAYPDTEILDESSTIIHYKFDTAWSPPVPAIQKLSMLFPNIVFTLDYEEETSWGGEIEFTNGSMKNINSYEYRCECGEEWQEEPELDDDGHCPECKGEE